MKHNSMMKSLLIALFTLLMGIGNGAWAEEITVTKTMKAIVEENEYTVSANSDIGTICSSMNLDANITLSVEKKAGATGNTGSFWGTTTVDWRLYQADAPAVTVSAGAGYTIKTVKFTYSNSNTGKLNTSGCVTNVGALSFINTNTAYDVDDTSVTYYVGNTSNKTNGQVRISAVEVVYETTGGSTKTLTSVAVTGTPTKTTYYDGDKFDPAGLVVTGTYSDSNTETITNGITWNVTPETLTTGTTSVSVTATVSSVTSPSVTINGLTVNAIPEKTIAEFIAAEGGKCYLTGTVSNIKNTTYGNYDLTDESGTIYVYGTLTPAGVTAQFASLGVAAGDKIKVLAESYEYYNNTTHEAKNVIFVEELVVEKEKRVVTIETPENGTLTVKNNSTTVNSGDEVEEGATLTIYTEPAAGYRLKNWQAVDGSTHTYTSATTYTVGESNVTIKANFEPIPVYTVTYMSLGSTIGTEQVTENENIANAPTATLDGWTFEGWTADNTFTTGTTAPTFFDSPVTTDITLYAVFTKTEGGSGNGTAVLTNEEICKTVGGSYATGSITNDYGTWNYNAAKQGNVSKDGEYFMQLRNNATISYLQIPVMSGNITSVTLHRVCNTTKARYTEKIAFRETAANNATNIAEGTQDAALTDIVLDIPAGYTTGYIMATGACRISYVTVTYTTGTTTYTTQAPAAEGLSVNFKAAGLGYATVYDYDHALSVPTGVKAYGIVASANGETMNATEITSDIIPANTAVVLYKENLTADETVVFPYSSEAGTPVESCLFGSTEDTDITAALPYSDFYVFSIVEGTPGFYKFGGTVLGAHKAYYSTDKSAGNSKEFNVTYNETTVTITPKTYTGEYMVFAINDEDGADDEYLGIDASKEYYKDYLKTGTATISYDGSYYGEYDGICAGTAEGTCTLYIYKVENGEAVGEPQTERFSIDADYHFLSTASTRGFIISFDNDVLTSIESIVPVAPAHGSFDLQGRRVNAATRGLFIQNGKKVIR